MLIRYIDIDKSNYIYIIIDTNLSSMQIRLKMVDFELTSTSESLKIREQLISNIGFFRSALL